MPSRKIKRVLTMFRAHFQEGPAEIPLALRQESPDIVYTALLEEDEDSVVEPVPYLGGVGPDMPALTGGSDPEAMVESLLGASREPGQGPPQPPQGPMAPPEPAQAPQGAQEPAMPSLDEMLGMM